MTRFSKRCPNCRAINMVEKGKKGSLSLYCGDCGIRLYSRNSTTKLCLGCGRFMAIDSERNFLPHKFLLSDKWCVKESE